MKVMKNQQLINEGYIEGKKSFAYQWEKIEPNFDWESVYKVMHALDWHWITSKRTREVPDIYKIKEHAKKTLFRVWRDEIVFLSSGGFSAGYEDGELWLEFTIDNCHTTDL